MRTVPALPVSARMIHSTALACTIQPKTTPFSTNLSSCFSSTTYRQDPRTDGRTGRARDVGRMPGNGCARENFRTRPLLLGFYKTLLTLSVVSTHTPTFSTSPETCSTSPEMSPGPVLSRLLQGRQRRCTLSQSSTTPTMCVGVHEPTRGLADIAAQALEPHISGEIMELHHTKHHQTYVTGLNTAEESYAKASSPKEQIKLQAALKFNGGGASPTVNLRALYAN